MEKDFEKFTKVISKKDMKENYRNLVKNKIFDENGNIDFSKLLNKEDKNE